MIQRIVMSPKWTEPTITASEVANSIVQCILSERSKQVVLPGSHTWVETLNSWPNWLQEGLRDSGAVIIDAIRRWGLPKSLLPRISAWYETRKTHTFYSINHSTIGNFKDWKVHALISWMYAYKARMRFWQHIISSSCGTEYTIHFTAETSLFDVLTPRSAKCQPR